MVSALALAAAALPRPAVAAAPAASWALSPIGQYQYTLAPGATATGAIALVNGQSQTQTLSLYSADMLSIGDGGFAPAPQGAGMTGVGLWLSLGETTVSVPAETTISVPFTVSVPTDAAPGEYDGAIVATAPGAPGSGGMGVSTRTALTVAVAVPVARVQVAGGQQTDLTTPDGSVEVLVPPGALPAGAFLTVSPATGGPVPVFPALPVAATAAVGPLVLRGRDAGDAPLAIPSRPLSVTVRLPPGGPSVGLFLLEFDPVLHAWLPLPTLVRHGAAQAQIDRLTAVAVATDPGVSVYPDVAGGWAEAPVLGLEALGDVSGYPDGLFRPDVPVTRTELATLLQRALRLPAGRASDLSDFTDSAMVPAWGRSALAAAVDAHLLAGEAGGALDPGGDVTRAEAAVIAARALGLGGGPDATFSDAGSVPAWAASGVDAAVQSGLLDGYPDGTFRPLQPVTRAEAAALILRLLRRQA